MSESGVASTFVPTLDYDTTTLGFNREVSIALPLVRGGLGHWIPTRVFGLEIKDHGTLDHGGPPGHPVFAVFTCAVQSCYYVGFAYFSLVGSPGSPALAHIRVLAPGHPFGPMSSESGSSENAKAD